MSAHLSLKGVSCFTLPQMGVVDDRLKWTNVAICLEKISQEVFCTFTVYTPRKELEFYPNSFHSHKKTSSEPNHCAVVTPEEMLSTKIVKERTSWNRPDSKLVRKQRAVPAIKVIILALERFEKTLKDSR